MNPEKNPDLNPEKNPDLIEFNCHVNDTFREVQLRAAELTEAQQGTQAAKAWLFDDLRKTQRELRRNT